MVVLLLVAGIGFLLAGLVAIGFGIPINEFGFGNTLIVAGTVAACTGMLLLVRTVVQAPAEGWGSAVTLASFALAAALLALFVTIEQRTSHPLVRLGILRSGSLARANVAGGAMFGCYIGFQFVATLFLQNELGWSAIHTALAFLPAGLLVAFGAPRIGALADRFGTERLVALAAEHGLGEIGVALERDVVQADLGIGGSVD